ncbi:hypothetical protein HDV02_000167 [Globomyces sp. JEL0801]|nr:hypothetical protein HDV02_000167 [Globomyces sp. JEL0801]
MGSATKIEKVSKKKKRLSVETKVKAVEELQQFVASGRKGSDILTKLAVKYKIKASYLPTLLSRSRKDGPKKSYGNNLFTCLEELTLAQMIKGFSLSQNPLNRLQTIELAKLVYPGRMKNGVAWFKRFCDEWVDDISFRTSKGLGKNKGWKKKINDQDIVGDIKQWSVKFPKWLKAHEIDSEGIMTADEIRIQADGTYINQKVHKPSSRESKNLKCCTYIPFIASSGVTLLHVFVLPFTNDIPEVLNFDQTITKTTVPVLYCFSDTGCLKKEHWKSLMEALVTRKNLLCPQKPLCLLLDNLDMDHDLETAVYLMQNDVHICYMVPNASHFLQPCDDQVLETYKRSILRRLKEDGIFNVSSDSEMDSFLNNTTIQEVLHITPDVVKSSFEAVGIVPWNRQTILKRTKVHALNCLKATRD